MYRQGSNIKGVLTPKSVQAYIVSYVRFFVQISLEKRSFCDFGGGCGCREEGFRLAKIDSAKL